METKVLTVLMALFLAASLVSAGDAPSSVWSPQFGVDFLQPSYNLQGVSREFHTTLLGANVSLLRVGRFRFPTAGLDLQVRFNQDEGIDHPYHKLGFFLLSSGVKYIIRNDSTNAWGYHKTEVGIHIKGQYATRVDPDPRVGRWGIATGIYLTF
ncbi:MAG TPA: hypothetical protein VJ553_00155 [Candidatus Paceibacterota bacterium]|nr:hypothetical protein [Candidatus Paceibacterota bacterium]